MLEVCGNGVTDCGEQCDDGNPVDTDACRNNCTLPPPPCVGTPLAGAYLFYSFDSPFTGGVVTDSSGAGRHGTVVGSGVTQVAAGKVGGAVTFTGGGRIAVGVLDPPSSGSAVFWLRTSAPTSERDRVFGGHDAFEFVLEADGRWTNQLFMGGPTPRTAAVQPVGVWRHVVATYSPAGLRLYLDGVLDPAANGTWNLDPGVLTLSVGTRTGTTDWLEGTLDELQLLDRVVSASEAADLYATQSACP
jgi:cysteine-rich repeat protein